MSIEIDIDGTTYRIDKLPAMQQFHVSRKIAPLIPAAIGPFLAISAMKGGIDKNLQGLVSELQPFAEGIATLPDADAEFVLSTCLTVVRRKAGESWMPIWNSTHKAALSDDLDLGVMVRLTLRVIIESLGPFIRGVVTAHLAKPQDSKA
jgi:hypothetical protein